MLNVPGPHREQLLEPEALAKYPAGQGVQSLLLMDPTTVEYVPAGQSIQVEDPFTGE